MRMLDRTTAMDLCPGSAPGSQKSPESEGREPDLSPPTAAVTFQAAILMRGHGTPTNQMLYRQALHHRPPPPPMKEQQRSPRREEPSPAQVNEEGQQNAGGGECRRKYGRKWSWCRGHQEATFPHQGTGIVVLVPLVYLLACFSLRKH